MTSEPGGFLQWVEMDHPTHRFEKARLEHTFTYLQQAGTFPSTLGNEDSRMDPRLIHIESFYTMQLLIDCA